MAGSEYYFLSTMLKKGPQGGGKVPWIFLALFILAFCGVVWLSVWLGKK